MKISRPFLLFQVFVVLFLIFLFFGKQKLMPKPKLPVMGAVPQFKFASANGPDVTHDSLTGKIWVANFIFTSCAGPCPMMSRQMQWLQRSFKGENRIKLVSVSVDPTTDTPEVLKGYAEKYEADLNQWYFLTGPEKDIQAFITQGFKLGMVEGEPALHSTRFVLVDSDLKIRGYYDAVHDEERNILVRDIGQLLGEEPKP